MISNTSVINSGPRLSVGSMKSDTTTNSNSTSTPAESSSTSSCHSSSFGTGSNSSSAENIVLSTSNNSSSSSTCTSINHYSQIVSRINNTSSSNRIVTPVQQHDISSNVSSNSTPPPPGVGELSVFSFLMAKSTFSALSHLPEEVSSCVHTPNCRCTQKHPSSVAFTPIRPRLYPVSSSTMTAKDGGDGRNNKSYLGLGTPYSSLLLNHCTMDSTIFRSLEKGVLYPVIHWSFRNNSSSSENLTRHPQHRHNDALQLLDTDSAPGVVFNQGVYKELKRVIPPDASIHKSTPPPVPTRYPPSSLLNGANGINRPLIIPSPPVAYTKKTWLLLGYKSLDKTLDSTLETTWKEWTGTRHIYLNLRHDFDIQRISFFIRVQPRDNLDLFMYVVLMQIGNVDDKNVMWLLDFVQRTRVERMKGFITVYTEVESQFSSINEEYLRYFSPDGSSKTESNNTNKGGVERNNANGAKFIDKLLQDINETPLIDYF